MDELKTLFIRAVEATMRQRDSMMNMDEPDDDDALLDEGEEVETEAERVAGEFVEKLLAKAREQVASA